MYRGATEASSSTSGAAFSGRGTTVARGDEIGDGIGEGVGECEAVDALALELPPKRFENQLLHDEDVDVGDGGGGGDGEALVGA